MRNWRTTLSGAGMVAGGIMTLAAMLLGGQMPTPQEWTMLGGAIVTGFGLIAAADGKNMPPPSNPT